MGLFVTASYFLLILAGLHTSFTDILFLREKCKSTVHAEYNTTLAAYANATFSTQASAQIAMDKTASNFSIETQCENVTFLIQQSEIKVFVYDALDYIDYTIGNFDPLHGTLSSILNFGRLLIILWAVTWIGMVVIFFGWCAAFRILFPLFLEVSRSPAAKKYCLLGRFVVEGAQTIIRELKDAVLL